MWCEKIKVLQKSERAMMTGNKLNPCYFTNNTNIVVARIYLREVGDSNGMVISFFY